MIAQNVHAALLALLLEGTAPLQTQARAARLLANLAFQPPNKVVLTEAGAVEARQATLERTIPTHTIVATARRGRSTTHGGRGSGGVVTAGRWGRSLRPALRGCGAARCHAFYSASSTSRLGGGRRRTFNAAAAEATRALSSLGVAQRPPGAHRFSNTPVALLELVDKTAAARGGVIGGATVRVCLECGADATDDEDDAASSSEDDTDADQTAAMLSRALLALTNLLGDPRRTAAASDAPIAAGDGRARARRRRAAAAGQRRRPQLPRAEPL